MKKSLRQNALAYRERLSAGEIQVFELKISASLVTLLQTFKPCTVGLFYPTRGEPNILGIMGNSSLKGFRWALPVCCESATDRHLKFAEYISGGKLEAGKYNIPVPVDKKWVSPSVLVVPCLGFHRSGTRLGYGAGWYDQTLAGLNPRPLTIGIAYSGTGISNNFAQTHDELLDYLITDQSTIDNSRKSQ